MPTVVSGQKMRASTLNNATFANLVGGYIATAAANVLSGGTATTETDLGSRCTSSSINFTNGHTYLAALSIGGAGGIAGDSWAFYLRLVNSVGGSGSVLFSGTSYLQMSIASNGFDITKSAFFLYVASSTFSSQVFTSYKRAAGTGNLNVYGNSFTSCYVFDCGLTNILST